MMKQLNISVQACRWHVAPDEGAFRRQAVDIVLATAEVSIRERGQFHLVLAGGGTPRPIYKELRSAHTEWAAWHLYFGDERCVPENDPERNSRLAIDAWLSHVPIPATQIHLIPGELGARKAAASYAALLRGLGNFDLVLLGLGEDGHTASLFPGNDWGVSEESADVLPVFDAPKPPPERVTLSAARLSRAGTVLFLVSGESKRKALADWRSGCAIPASAICPPKGVDVLISTELLDSTVAN
jgi:6-phosphogluconolactonase